MHTPQGWGAGGFQRTEHGLCLPSEFPQRTFSSWPTASTQSSSGSIPGEGPSNPPPLAQAQEPEQATTPAIQSPYISFLKYFISGHPSSDLQLDLASLSGFFIV